VDAEIVIVRIEMKLIIYTTKTCIKCPSAKKIAKEVAKELKLKYEEKDMEICTLDALQLQIASTPSIVLDDEVLFRGCVPPKEELIREIKKWIPVLYAEKRSKKNKGSKASAAKK
jgi:predicted thioredoxin/glutaredoxin